MQRESHHTNHLIIIGRFRNLIYSPTDSDCVCVLSSMWPPEEQREKPGTFQNYSSFWHVTRILQPIGSLVFGHSTIPAHIPLDVPLAPTPNPLHAAKSKLVSSHSSWKTSPWPMRSNMACSRLGFSRMICQNPSRQMINLQYLVWEGLFFFCLLGCWLLVHPVFVVWCCLPYRELQYTILFHGHLSIQ